VPTSASQNPLSHLWGSFQAAVNDPDVRAQPGGVQQYVWASVRSDFLSRGENLPPNSFAAVNELLSLAGQQRAANTRLQAAINSYQKTGLDAAIMAEHTAPDIDSRALNEQLLGPAFRIRYEAPFMADGGEIFLPLTWDPGIQIPQSISELMSGLDEAAFTEAGDYGYEYSGGATVVGITTV
jgi:hypothetical protein